MSDLVQITRVYNSDEKKQKLINKSEVKAELEFNSIFRFGCAIFVGAECMQTGYLGAERCAIISKELENVKRK